MPSSRELRHATSAAERIGVGAVPRQVDARLEPEAVDLSLNVGAKRAVTNQEALRARHHLDDSSHRANEVERILVTDELRNLHDQPAVLRYSQRCERLRGCARHDAADVDAVRNDDDSIGRDAARREDARHGLRDRDHHRCATILPPCSRVRPQRKIHAPRYGERNTGAEVREGGDGYGVRSMRVHDVDAMVANHATQPPRRTRIDLAERTAIDHGQSRFGSPRAQGLAPPHSEDRSVSSAIHLARKPKRLTLAAAPAALRVDVKHSKSHGAQLPAFDQCTQGRRQGMRATC
jgi:hypothetical protein